MAIGSWNAWRSILTLSTREASRPDHPNAALRTRYLVLSRRAAWRHVQTCIEGLGRAWTIEEETPASGQFRLTRRTMLRWFTSDVTVSLFQADERRLGVEVISASRFGGIDFGQNARNIRDFYRALEAYVQRLPPSGPPTPNGDGEPEPGSVRRKAKSGL